MEDEFLILLSQKVWTDQEMTMVTQTEATVLDYRLAGQQAASAPPRTL